MKKNWLIGAAAVLAAGLPGAALADTDGHVKFTYASLDEEGDADKESAIALSGAVVTDMGDAWRLQFNGAGASMDHTGHNDEFSQFEAHLIHGFDNFSLGAFTGHFNQANSGFWEFGAEAGITFGQFGITGSASALTATGDGGDDGSNLGVNGYFNLTDNISISGHGSWTDFGFDDEVDSYGIGAHFAFGNGLGVGVGWRTSDFDTAETDTIGVSLNWNFGEGGHNRMLPGAMGLIPDAVASQ